ncbi:efflux RND transporter periplasmic adaptor subunit [Candidatus Shapirobacteria bacterium]|nr:efflux RND transporter periplasmic adaptor subunit [Candidatus Shapirobacteria bacterium]
MKTKVKYLIIFLIGVGGWLIYANLFKNKTATVSYQTAVAEKGTLITTLSGSGQISSVNNRAVTTSTSGVVSKVYVKNGQKVIVGTVVASVDLDMTGRQARDSAYTSYLSAKNTLETTKNSLLTLQSTLATAYDKFHNDAGARGLATDDVTYVNQYNAYQSAQFNVNNFVNQQKIAEQQVANAWSNYQQASNLIYAPISGVISGLSLKPGMVISGGTTGLKVANITTSATPTVTVNLTEVDIPKLTVGNKATITLDALAEKSFTGTVVAIDKLGSVSSGVVNYPVVIQLDSVSEEVFPNMSASAKIITSVKDNVILVASTAVKKTNGVATIQVMKNGKPVNIDVEVGGNNDTQTEIISGIIEGDLVVTSSTSASKATGTSTSTSVFGGSNRGFGGAGAVRVGR